MHSIHLLYSIDRWLVPVPVVPAKQLPLHDRLPHQFTAPYIKNNYVFLSFLVVYIAINVGLFVSRVIQYSDQNGLVIIARACGESKLICFFINHALIQLSAPFRAVSQFQLCLRARPNAAQMHHIPSYSWIWRLSTTRQSHISAQDDRLRDCRL